MAAYLFLALALLTYQAVYKVFQLRAHIRAAQQTGLPYTISLIHELEIWAYLTDPILKRACRGRLMRGRGWPRWARFMVKDWHYEDRRRAHDEYGSVFLVVSPAGMVCYVGEADAAAQVLTRRKAFVKPREKMKMLEPFGPNVVSVDGDRWRFHLAVTLPPFAADNVLGLLWDETCRQVDVMAAAWKRAGDKASLKRNVYSLTMNTMSLVGFGKQSEWTDGADAVPQEHTLSLVGAIYAVVMHLPHILLLPKRILKLVGPKAFTGYDELERYMTELLGQEKARLLNDSTHKESSRETLLTAVLRSNNSSKPGGTSLTDTEVKGNIFMFLLAGYDTTANTILFCCITLALYPAVQDCLIEEVDRVWTEAERAGRSELSLVHDMPKFRYLIAFMYEVMRVFPIVLPIARETSGPQPLSLGDTAHLLPSRMGVIVNNTAIHHDARNWPSPSVIDPRRWMVSNPHAFDPREPASPDQVRQMSEGNVKIPGHRRGTFMSFGEGPRACLGRNFAKTEFVAFYSRLSRKYRLRIGDGVDAEMVERVIRLRSGGSPVTLIPPEDVRINLVERV
ncbi:putative cytochrome P450 oxidoreductase [Decorospora gaudefroyi]|uniref:Putative cytochrome P450 oxidoreductase n=1 Tax=Decorospora gaudefroyi TaxID=184978 RepID=A0A6A5K3H8_9PLEO|nr:putative cytochrome P450 oxidoreductase [Decorospora gaudefroyi]